MIHLQEMHQTGRAETFTANVPLAQPRYTCAKSVLQHIYCNITHLQTARKAPDRLHRPFTTNAPPLTGFFCNVRPCFLHVCAQLYLRVVHI
jgi:hypothetical protein